MNMVRNNKGSIRSKVFEAKGVPGMPGNTVLCKNVEQLLKHMYGTETDETRRAIEKAWNDHCVGKYDNAIIRKMPNSDEYRIIFGCDKSGKGSSVAAIYNPGHGPTESDPNGAAQLFKTVDLNAGEKVNKIDFDKKPAIDEVKTKPEELEKQGAGLGGNNSTLNGDNTNKEGGDTTNKEGGDTTKKEDGTTKKEDGTTKKEDGDTTKKEDGDTTKKEDGDTTKKEDGDTTTKEDSTTKKDDGDTTTKEDGTTNNENTNNGTLSKLADFFTQPEVLISVAAIAGIITMFAILSKSIKARFRKTAKSLYRLQKDFGGSPEGLDMDNAFKGQGSRITDILVKVFGFGKKGKGAIGILPFVKNYQDEIKSDYNSAVKSFNMISQAGKDQPGDETDQEKNESFNIPTYKSFSEAYNARKLNESAYSGEEINESVVATISSAVLLGKLAYSAGKFVWSKMGKDGKMEPAQAIQVTKQSTREVCYSIMNCFLSKYFNMEGVSAKLGLDVNHLSDIDKSNVDKFKKLVVAMKTEQKDNARVSKMYSRVQKQYNEMLKRYFTIAEKVVDNFETYSKKDKSGNYKNLSEKEQNLLTSGAEKLRMEISRQRDLYENNFFRVINAIVASPEYIQYVDFIIENVLPVFETGNAGDADYVLNTMPRKNEYFLVRQTKNATEVPNPKTVDMRNGNVALVMVEEVTTGENGGAPIVKFKRVGLFKSIEGDAKVEIQDDGTVDYETIDENKVNLDTKAYAKDVDGKETGESQSLEYTKWIAIDPIQVVNYKPKATPADDSAAVGMRREYNNAEEFIFIVPAEDTTANNTDVEKSEGRDAGEYQPDLAVNEAGEEGAEQDGAKKVAKIEFVTKDEQNNPVVNVITPQDKEMRVEAVKNLLLNGDDINNKFVEIPSNDVQGKKEDASKIQKKIESDNKTQAEIVAIINHTNGGENNDDNASGTKEVVVKKLTNNIAAISENVYKTFNNVLSNTQNLAVRAYKSGSGEASTTTSKLLRANSLQTVDTGVLTTANHKLVVMLDIYAPKTKNLELVKNNNYKIVPQYKNTQDGSGIETNTDSSTGAHVALIYKNAFVIRMFFTIIDDNNIVVTPGNRDLDTGKGTAQIVNGNSGILDDGKLKEAITNGINELILRYKSADSYIKETTEETLGENVVISYSVSNMNESYNSVSIKRDMVFENSKSTYVLSTFAWGDGTVLYPSNYVKESIETIINNANDYYDIASVAKRDKSVKLVPITESLIYNIPMPHNRYAVLTNGNPLYEAVAIIKVDDSVDHNIVASRFIGVNRITK